MHCRRLLVCLGMVVVGSVVAGCSREAEKPQVKHMRGTAESIDRVNRVIEVRTYIEKFKREEIFPVRFDEHTEIMINGRIATFDELRVGETAEGDIKVIKGEKGRECVALRVSVERAETLTAPGQDGSGDG